MRDHEARASSHGARERFLNNGFGLRVERARRLVQDQDARVFQKDARDRDALAFAAGELVAAVADDRLVPLRQRADDVVDVGGLRRRFDLGLRRAEPAVADVPGHGVVKKVRLLRHDPDVRAELVDVDRAHVLAVDRNRAGVAVVETQQQVRDRRLARTRRADDRHGLPAADPKGHVMQRGPPVAVREPHVLELDVPERRYERCGARPRRRFGREVEVLEHAVEHGEGRDELKPRAQQRRCGRVQPREQRDERDLAANDQVAPGQPHEGGREDRDRVERHHEPTRHHRCANLERHEARTERAQPARFKIPPGERFHERDPGERQRVLQQRRELIVLFPRRAPHVVEAVAGPVQGQQHRGHEREGQEHQTPVQRRHCEHRRDRRQHVRHHAGRDADQRAVDRVDVAGDTVEHVARARLREERDGQAMEMRHQLRAQISRDRLAQQRRGVRLNDAEQDRDARGRDHEPHVERDLVQVSPRQAEVHEARGQQCGHDTEHGADRDAAGDREGIPCVRAHEREEPRRATSTIDLRAAGVPIRHDTVSSASSSISSVPRPVSNRSRNTATPALPVA